MALTAGCGAVLGLSLQGTAFGWWASLLSAGILFSTLRGRSPGEAIVLGAVSGLGAYGISSEWALLFGTHAYVALVAALLAYWLIVAVGASFARTFWGVVVAGPSALALSELARARFPLGGYALAGLSSTQVDGPLVSAASVIGAAGVSGLAAAAGVVVVGAFGRLWMMTWRGMQEHKARIILAALTCVGVVLLQPAQRSIGLMKAGVSAQRGTHTAQGAAGERETSSGVRPGTFRVAVVQAYPGNRPLSEEEEAGRALLALLEQASLDAAGLQPNLLIWPEASLGSGSPGSDPMIARAVSRSARVTGAWVLANGQPPTADLKAFVNRNFLFTPEGHLDDVSDKEKLVPFGEYVPWREVLSPRVTALSRVPVDGRPGRWRVFEIDGVRIGVVVCFESTFSQSVRDRVVAGAELVVVETNNRSFEYSSLSRQHLTASRLRAAETGRFVVHAALSGISAIIRPDGKVARSAGLFDQQVLVDDLIPRTDRTLYVRFGDTPAAAAFAGALGLFACHSRKRRRKASNLRVREGD